MSRKRIANMGSSAYLQTCAAPGYALQEVYLLGKQGPSRDPAAHNIRNSQSVQEVHQSLVVTNGADRSRFVRVA